MTSESWRRSSFVILIFLILGSCTTLVLQCDFDGDWRFEEAPTLDSQENATRAVPSRVPAAQPREGKGSETRDGASEAIETSMRPSAVDAVLRVRGPDGEAIAGARLSFLASPSEAELDAEEFAFLAERRELSSLEGNVQTELTDAAGLCRIPDLADELVVWVEAEGYDCRHVRRYLPSEFRNGVVGLELARRKDLVVQLESELGQVLKDIPVGLFCVLPSSTGDMIEISSGLSDESGLVRLAAPVEDAPLPGYAYLVALMFPANPLANVYVESFEASETPVALEVPPYGVLHLRFGAPELLRLRPGQLIGLRTGRADRERRFRGDVLRAPIEADGLVRFAPIGLELALSLNVGVLDRDSEAWFTSAELPDFPGPTRADEIVVVDAPPAPTTTELAFEVCAPDGRSLSGHKVRLSSPFDDRILRLVPNETRLDADSRAHVHLSALVGGDELASHEARKRERLGLHVAWIDNVNDAMDAPGIRIPLPPRPWPDRLDLGCLTLEAPPLLVSGRVCDAEGRPVPRALLEWAEVGSRPRLPMAYPSQLSCDHDGRFRIGEWHDPDDCDSELAFQDDLGLWAWAPGYQLAFHATPSFPKEGIEFRLQPAVRAELEVKLSPGVDPDFVLIELSGSAMEAWRANESGMLMDANGSVMRRVDDRVLTLDNLGPGRLVVRALASKNRLIEFDRREFEIEQAGPGETLRLTFDLQGDLLVSRILVKSESGDVLNHAVLRWRDPMRPESDSVREEQADESGHISLPAAMLRRDCVLVAEGFEAKHFEGAPPSGTVILRRARSVVVEVTAPQVDLDGVNFHLWFTHPLLGGFYAQGNHGHAEIALPEPGHYEVELVPRNSLDQFDRKIQFEYPGDESRLSLHFTEEN